MVLIYIALLSKALYSVFTVTDIHPFTHRRLSQPRRATVSSSGAIRVRRLAQGHHDTWLGGAGDRTSDLAITSQPLYLLS